MVVEVELEVEVDFEIESNPQWARLQPGLPIF